MRAAAGGEHRGPMKRRQASDYRRQTETDQEPRTES
jgi:hypothetical protein